MEDISWTVKMPVAHYQAPGAWCGGRNPMHRGSHLGTRDPNKLSMQGTARAAPRGLFSGLHGGKVLCHP